MIQSLKKKFILVSMSLVLVVLLAVFTALCVSTASSQRQTALRSLETLLRRDTTNPQQFEIGKPSSPSGSQPQRSNDLLAGFVATIGEDGSVTVDSADSVTVSDETAEAAAAIAQDASQDSGLIRTYSLRYLRVTEDGVTRIAFLDASSDITAMTELIVTSLFVGALALLAFFFASLFLSNWALKPVEASWNRQKQFVADASHELKTPLTVILANQKILLAHPSHTIAEERQWIENTSSEGSRMKLLIEDLLFLAKSDSERVKQTCAEVCLTDAAQGALLSFASVAFEAGVTLEDDLQPNVMLQGNESQLRRLCGILLDNAVKYAGTEGTVRVELRAGGSSAVLRVHNTGEPIPENGLTHIFERFYRVDSARSAGGYGLGLSIAESIVRSHGGRISVTSSAAAGTAFTVTLPLRAPARRRGKDRL